MKICQIMIYGGKHNWIDLSQRKDPNVSWFIFVGVEPKGEIPDYWEKIEQKIDQLESLQRDFPASEKIKYSYIRVESENAIVNLIRFFRALINQISEKEFQISCNLTAGIFELKMALFLASQIESDKILEIFYLNKQSFEKNFLFKSIKISNKGKNLLNTIFEEIKVNAKKKELMIYNTEFSLSQLRDICKTYGFKMDLPTISRLVTKLIKDGYLKERRDGRNKFISLTDIGLIFCPVEKFKEKI